MLRSFIADIQAGLKWFASEMAREMPGVPSGKPKTGGRKLEPRRSRGPAAAASSKNNYDEDRNHNQAYDGDVFHSDSDGDGDGD